MATNISQNKAISFALNIINLAHELNDKHEYVIGNQILRSGTSFGANLSEAHYAQSRADFISKLSIALKETNETKYWLLLLYKSKIIPQEKYSELDFSCNELCLLITSSIKTAKSNSN